jgi:hypothetical protein
MTVGSGIAPKSADPSSQKAEGARGLGVAAITAGGELHPALRTLRQFIVN